jgi:hypothetical protein
MTCRHRFMALVCVAMLDACVPAQKSTGTYVLAPAGSAPAAPAGGAACLPESSTNPTADAPCCSHLAHPDHAGGYVCCPSGLNETDQASNGCVASY